MLKWFSVYIGLSEGIELITEDQKRAQRANGREYIEQKQKQKKKLEKNIPWLNFLRVDRNILYFFGGVSSEENLFKRSKKKYFVWWREKKAKRFASFRVTVAARKVDLLTLL